MAETLQSQDMLPTLRNDLRLKNTGTHENPTLQIYDPLSHRYFDIGSKSTALLGFWHLKNPKVIIDAAAKLGIESAEATLEKLLKFLKQNNLLQINLDDNWSFFKIARAQKKTFKARFASIIFYRLKMGNPDRLITALYPFFAPMYTRTFQWLTILAAFVAGLFLFRHPELISEHFGKLATFNNAILAIIAITIVKAFHELGHAMQAKRRHLNIPGWGIMFILGFPLPFTELSNSWTLENKNDRIRIDAGGILAELVIAVWAALLFIFWPDGAFRVVLFMLAASSLILSLAVNLNPLMRFDGYFLLSDITGIKNLQPRSAALGLWSLRKTVLGLEDPPPENLPKTIHNRMIAYSIAVWVYRLTLYIGIALIAYNMLSRVLGLTVFILEIWFFIIVPILKELRVWIGRVGEFYKNRRAWVSAFYFAVILGFIFFPFHQKITLPARISPVGAYDIFTAGEHVMVSSPSENKTYQENDTLWQFRINGSAQEKARFEKQMDLINLQIERAGATAQSLGQLPLLIQQRERLKEQIEQINSIEDTLMIRAKLPGSIYPKYNQLLPALSSERPVLAKTRVGTFVPDTAEKCEISGYIDADNIQNIAQNSSAIFMPDGHAHIRLNARVSNVSPSPVQQVSTPEAAQMHGGPIEISPITLAPVSSWHSIQLETKSKFCLINTPMIFTGYVIATGRAKSYAQRIFDRVANVLVRELSY